MKTYLLLLILAIPHVLLSQQRQISGTVRSSKDAAPLPGAIIELESAELPATVTDIEGNFTIAIPAAEEYLLCKMLGFQEKKIAIPAHADTLTIFLNNSTLVLNEVILIEYKKPLISSDKSESTASYSTEKINSLPRRSVNEDAVITGGVYSKDAESAAIKGARTDAEEYYVDGMKSRGLLGVSINSVKKEKVITGDTPAEYGDDTEAPEDGPSRSINEEPLQTPQHALASVLTAGEVNDFTKWELWQDIASETLAQYQDYWQMRPLQRYTVQLVNEQNLPVINAAVALKSPSGEIIWEAKTDNTGKAELWKNLFSEIKQEAATIEIHYAGTELSFEKPKSFHDGINVYKLPQPCYAPEIIDIAFVVDATGSMQDEISYLQAEMGDVMRRFSRMNSTSQVRIGSVFYRDIGDAYVTRSHPFSNSIAEAEDFIYQQYASGGGDDPEAVDEGLHSAIDELEWKEEAKARILFLLLDAPPHHNATVMERLERLTAEAARKGIRIVPIGASGTDRATEYLMRSMALATNGTYVFLTDHSGVGNAHLEAVTDEYKVELLNEALLRIMQQFTQAENCGQPKDKPKEPADTAAVPPVASLDSIPGKPDPTKPGPVADDFAWKYYPNPSAGIFYVEMEKPVKEIFVADMNGKILQRVLTNDEQKVRMNLTPFPRGMYLIRFEHEGKMYTGKLVKIANGGGNQGSY